MTTRIEVASTGDLENFIANAKPGDSFVYHRGHLTIDINDDVSTFPKNWTRWMRILVFELQKYLSQDVLTFAQKRLQGESGFEYIAYRTRRKLEPQATAKAPEPVLEGEGI